METLFRELAFNDSGPGVVDAVNAERQWRRRQLRNGPAFNTTGGGRGECRKAMETNLPVLFPKKEPGVVDAVNAERQWRPAKINRTVSLLELWWTR